MKSTTLSGTTTSYLYDGDGKRLRASTGTAANQITNYLWDVTTPGVPQIALERDGGGILLRRYQHGADLISMTAPTSLYYFHHDDLGSVMNVTSSTGVKQWTYTYEPYGIMKTETKNKNTAPATVLKFAGEQLDSTSLYHLRARQYDPATGRFLAVDPIAAWPAAISPYPYVGGMPTTLIDPSGLAGENPDADNCPGTGRFLASLVGADDIYCEGFQQLSPTAQGLLGATVETGPYVIGPGGTARLVATTAGRKAELIIAAAAAKGVTNARKVAPAAARCLKALELFYTKSIGSPTLVRVGLAAAGCWGAVRTNG